MAIFDFLGALVKPVTDLIDNLHTSVEEKGALQLETLKLQNIISMKLLDYEAQLLGAKKDIIVAEAQGTSWLQKSWRPITMLTLLILTVCDSFGWLPNPLAKEAWLLIQISLGGYLSGKSIESVAPKIVEAVKSNGAKTTVIAGERRSPR